MSIDVSVINSRNALELALSFIERGWSPVPVPFKEKGPSIAGWQTLEITSNNAPQFFKGPRQNVGVKLGSCSNGLTDVDLDCQEAVALANAILPPTEACFGRTSKRRSHLLYLTDLSKTEQKAAVTFKDPTDGSMLVELRIGGKGAAQTVFPGSVHPSNEMIEWDRSGEPARIDGQTLKQRTTILAAMSLIARHWPAEGSRHEAALALGGFLARCGSKFADQAADTVRLLANVAGDTELKDRYNAAADAVARYRQGGSVYGLARLREIFGDKVSAAVAEWLEFRDEQSLTGRGRPTAADTLIGFAEEVEVFHSADLTGYADIRTDQHRETWPIRSKEFRLWLTRRYFEETKKAPNDEALRTAINAIEAKARFDGQERPVFLRTGIKDNTIYIDLCDASWGAVEVGVNGWRVVSNPPVRFRRVAGMLPLPLPISGTSIQSLRSFLNVQSDSDFVLTVAWLLAALRNEGPYPILAVSGAEGSAKSTFCKILRALVDPHVVPLRAPPKDNRSLFVGALNNHVLGYDNLSCIPEWMSDTLCRLATGGGHAERTNYTDLEETLFSAERPIILNGIPEVITLPDLANRTISVMLEPIPTCERRLEADVWSEFENARPDLLGALLDAMAHGLRALPGVLLDELPRMADFAKWIAACEVSLPWESGTFAQAYRENSEATTDVVSEGDEVVQAICHLMSEQRSATVNGERTRTWTGTATELLGILNDFDSDRDPKTWPRTPRGLRARLNRATRVLQDRHRITVQRSRQAHEGRIFTIIEHDVVGDDVPF